MSDKHMDLDKMGEIIDAFLVENEIKMLLTIPAGSREVHLQDNAGNVSTIQLYILLGAMEAALEQLAKDANVDQDTPGWKDLIHAMMQMVEDDLIGGEDNEG